MPSKESLYVRVKIFDYWIDLENNKAFVLMELSSTLTLITRELENNE